MKLDHKKRAASLPLTEADFLRLSRKSGAPDEVGTRLYGIIQEAYRLGIDTGYDAAVEEAKELLGVDV